jgi:hypothetical protein
MPICHLFLFFSFSFPSCVRLWKVTFFLWIQFFILLFYQFFPIFFVVWYRKCSESVIWTTFLCLVWKWIFIETVHFSTSANCYETTFLFYQIFSRKLFKTSIMTSETECSICCLIWKWISTKINITSKSVLHRFISGSL